MMRILAPTKQPRPTYDNCVQFVLSWVVCFDALRLGRADTTRSGKHLRIRTCEGSSTANPLARPGRDPGATHTAHLRLSRLQQLVSSGGQIS